MSNFPTLDQIEHIPIGDLAALPGEALAMLTADAFALAERAKTLKDWLHGALVLKYSDAAHTLRQSAGKDSGTVRIDEENVIVVCDASKKVSWDQAALRQAVETVKSWGSNPDEFVTAELKVSERAYSAWPTEIRKVFEPARTTATGKPTFAFEMKKVNAA